MKLADHLTFISNPVEAVQRALGEFDQLPQNDDAADPAAKLFQEVFDTREKVEQIPLLNDADVNAIFSGSLVRFRCMIQDNSLDQQIYQQYYLVEDPATGATKWKGVKYTDVAPANSVPLPKKVEQSDLRSVLGDRQPYYAVSVPAETEWARAAFSAAAPEPVASSSEPAATEIKPEDIALAKARFPLDNKNNTAALLIIYDTRDSFAVNDVYEVIGILERSTESGDQDMAMDEDPFLELQTRLPPQTIAPHLHVINYRKISCAGNPKCLDVEEAVKSLSKVNAKAIRAVLVERIANILGGDTLAAEYVLLHFLSRIYQRDAALALGNFPINLCGVTPEATADLVRLVQQILPRAHYLPLELSKINGVAFMPRNTESHGLAAGALQLAEGTQVIVDEGKLGEGTVQGVGVLNLHALKSVIDFGKLPFAILDGANDENNGEPQLVQNWLELPVNLNIMVVGATRSGIFPVECVVPVRSPSTVEPASLQTAISNLNISGEEAENKLLDDIRLYLGIMREGSYIVSDEMVKHIETDFVSTRSQQREQKQQVMSQQELIQLCAVARLICLSHATNTLSKEHWAEAKRLEQERGERVAAMLPRQRSEVAGRSSAR